jgi:6-phosphogluconolactonase
MKFEICSTAAAAGERAAHLIAESLGAAIAVRGCGTVAFSGGHTPADMFRVLAAATLNWAAVDIFQVDERIAGADDERRNLRAFRAAFANVGSAAARIHAMPVDDGPHEQAAKDYEETLNTIAGTPATLDVVHLGLGVDGHTASLFPGDAALQATAAVALSGPYDGLERMTLTIDVLNRARMRVWLVTGASKQAIVRRLVDDDPAMVAHRIRRDDSILVLDRDAAPGAA